MKIPAAHILKQFVNRTQEISEFETLLSGSTKRVMGVYGPGGIGKSILLSRMMAVADGRGLRWVYLEWEDSRRYSYLDIMRQLRDATERSAFQTFNDVVNFYTVPQYKVTLEGPGANIQGVSVLQGAEVSQSQVTVNIGHNIEIIDRGLTTRRPDQDVSEQEMMIEVTRAFITCLQTATANSPLVIFLDALEKADALTLKWMWEELLEAVRDEQLEHLLVILSGRNGFEPDPTFFDAMDVYELHPFKTDNIFDYLVTRGLEKQADALADFILAISNGNPLQVAMNVDTYLRMLRQKSR